MPVNPTTKVGLVNNALVRLGQRPVSSLSDPAAEAIAANLLYTEIKRKALVGFDWTFAVREFKPAVLANPIGDFYDQFTYAYQMPTDSLRILGLLYECEYAETADREIWTNASEPQLIYVSDADEADFSPEFATYMVHELAAAFALPLTQDMEREQLFRGLANRSLADARAIDSQRDTPIRLKYEQLLQGFFINRF